MSWKSLVRGGLFISLNAMLLAGFASHAAAQDGFGLQMINPVVGPNGIYSVEGSLPLDHLQPSFGTMLNYASRPLVGTTASGEEVSIVDQQLALHMQAGLGFWDRLQVDLSFPLYIISDGVLGPNDFGGVAPGDLNVRAKGSLLSIDRDGVGIALSSVVFIPTGEESSFTGTGTLSTAIRGIADVQLGRTYMSLNLGVRLGDQADLVDIEIGTEMLYGAGAKVSVMNGLLDLGLELTGRSGFNDLFGSAGTSPLEGILGVTMHTPAGVDVISGAGGGLIGGYGASAFRALFGIQYTMPDPSDTKQITPSDMAKDSDDDGYIDSEDKCPNQAEDRDMFKDDDGCPDPDNDEDGILDAEDECPDEAGKAEFKGCAKAPTKEPEAKDQPAPKEEAPKAPAPTDSTKPDDASPSSTPEDTPVAPKTETPAPANPPK